MVENRDILERIKAKEEEMEARIAGAKKTAASLRDEAAAKARAIREEASSGIGAEVGEAEAAWLAGLKDELDGIEAEAQKAAGELKRTGLARMDEAARKAFEFIAGGGGGVDKEDEEGPDHRA